MSAGRIPVLIVGGGPVGLAVAAELGWQGVACLLVERGDGVVFTPKMNEVNTRSMELCRRWGIAELVLDTPFPRDWPKDVAFVTSLFGHELGRMQRAPGGERHSEHSPEKMQICSQHWFDPILQRFARSLPPVELRYCCRLDAFEDRGDHVRAALVDTQTGKRETVEADYLVGCDGAGSTVRRTLGIGLEGNGLLGHAVNLFFRAPRLMADCGKADGTFFLDIDAEGVWGNLRLIEPHTGLWRLMVNEAEDDVSPETVDKSGYLRRALGRDYPVEWVDVNVWARRSVVAASYGRGRIFIAGDAVHQVSPTGALGMNTGLGDAVDIGWKLAAVVQGWGSARLLASYDAERRPVGARAVRMATAFHGLHSAFGAEDLAALEGEGDYSAAVRGKVGAALVSRLGAEFRTIGLQIGYRYDGSPVCIDDGTPPPPDDPETYHPTARPGARAPHVWLDDGRSILDHFGKGFVLLRLGPDAADAAGLAVAARERGVPLRVVAIAEGEARKVYAAPLVLVRPDGHVAWRGELLPPDAGAIIDTVRGA